MSIASIPTRRVVGKTLRWIVLLPVVMVGSLLYWSVAIGLGGLSLMTASALSSGTDSSLTFVDDSDNENAILDVGSIPISVHLEESAEPEDVNDNAGTAGYTAITDDQQIIVAPGPGSTSY